MAPLGYGLWVWFKDNKVAQYLTGAVIVAAIYKIYERLRDNRIRKQVEHKIEIKAQKTATKVITKAQEKTADVIEKADKARADIPRGTPSGELPDDIQDILFDD